MSLNSCVFAVRLSHRSGRDELEHRVEALRRFYEPLGDAVATTSFVDRLALLMGCIRFDGRSPGRGPLVWGGPLPAGLADEKALIEADDRELRAADGVVVALGSSPQRARIISGAAGIATLHHSSSDGVEAFATHAVAAAWLASGRASVAVERIPELLAHDYVGGEHSLIAEARVLENAMRIDFRPGETHVGSYWPAAERWEPVEEDRAYEDARVAFMEALERRLPREGAYLALTAGLDSRVVALALHELGRRVGTFTWGKPEWEDVVIAARTADELGFEHIQQPVEYRPDDAAMQGIDAEVRWTEGITPVRFAAQTWPAEMSAAVYGSGGEIGRAFYYGRERVRAFPNPNHADLERIFDGRSRLHAARREALRMLRESERAWIAKAEAQGVNGWRILDVLYADQRVRRWGRSMLSRMNAITIPAFSQPEIARAFVSLPLTDRVTDGFHRRFLSSMPALAAPEPAELPPQSRLHRALSGIPGARRRLLALRSRRPESGGRWPLADEWSSRPKVRSWVAEEVLGSPLIRDALGGRWAAETRAGFLKDETRATENAMLAAAPYALERALRELQPGRRQ